MHAVADIDKLITFLRAHRGERLCDECVRGLSGLGPEVDATHLATILVRATQMTQYRRVTSICWGCARRDFIVTYVG